MDYEDDDMDEGEKTYRKKRISKLKSQLAKRFRKKKDAEHGFYNDDSNLNVKKVVSKKNKKTKHRHKSLRKNKNQKSKKKKKNKKKTTSIFFQFFQNFCYYLSFQKNYYLFEIHITKITKNMFQSHDLKKQKKTKKLVY